MTQMHTCVWSAIDNIARDNLISCSRLAIISNLDSTSFNKSKRIDSNGKLHFPAFASIIKVMMATGISWEDFGEYMRRPPINP